MKKFLYLAASLLALNLTPIFGQTEPATLPPSPTFQQRLQMIKSSVSPQTETPVLTKFNLDFPGGTPEQLVKAIEKAMGKPLNAIIPPEDADLQMPPLKMNDVIVPQLFAALEATSRKTIAVSTGGFGSSYSIFTSDYGFKTADSPLTDAAIWYFHAEKPSMPPMVSTQKICRFYSLEIPLLRGFTVDDITTAIQTGWKMSGIASPPELNYHKETKLLIVFGEPGELNTIDAVLQTLPSSKAPRSQEDNMEKVVNQLKMDVEQLKKKVSAQTSPTAPAPEEKSGK
jgi:hypothetical protein